MELSVLIVNYNSESYLKNCLRSLYQNTQHRPIEVIVVDNASTDGSLPMLARDFAEVKVIASPDNLGFSRGNNLAMREATGRFHLLLNNDCLVEPGAIDTLLRIMQDRPDVGVIGPLLRNGDGSVQISFGAMIGFRTEAMQKFLSTRYERGNRLFRRYVEKRSRKEASPDWVSGACVMLRSELLDKVGFLDENFFMYTEEVDFCQRVRAHGYRVLYTPAAEIVHLGGKSTETNPDKATLEYRRSQLYFYSKHYGRGKVRILKAYLLSKLALHWTFGGSARRPLHSKLLRLVWKY